MTDFAGWEMPLRYGSETVEHNTVRSAAGLFDLSHMGEIEVVGPEAVRALDHAVVSDIGALGVTKAKYTMICQEDGGILDDLIVYRLADERYLVVANASNVEGVLNALRDRARGFDAEVLDRCADWALVALQGPQLAQPEAHVLGRGALGTGVHRLPHGLRQVGKVFGGKPALPGMSRADGCPLNDEVAGQDRDVEHRLRPLRRVEQLIGLDPQQETRRRGE